MDLFSPLNHWHWWILAAALGVAEMLAPGIFLMWIGVAAGFTGLVAVVAAGLGWEGQMLVFAVLAVFSAVAGRRIYRRGAGLGGRAVNRGAEQYVGRVFVLDTPIVNGSGRMRVADGTWKVAGPDCAAGSRVRVVAVDGVTLQVESAV